MTFDLVKKHFPHPLSNLTFFLVNIYTYTFLNQLKNLFIEFFSQMKPNIGIQAGESPFFIWEYRHYILDITVLFLCIICFIVLESLKCDIIQMLLWTRVHFTFYIFCLHFLLREKICGWFIANFVLTSSRLRDSDR